MGSARRRQLIIGLAVLGMGLAVGLRELVGWDVFWHMLVGKLAIESGSALPTEPFSYSVAGSAWPYKDLTADVLLYLAWDGLGPLGLALLQAGAVVLVAVGIARMVAPEDRSWPALLVLIGVAVAAAQTRMVPRPVLFSLALFPGFLALLEQARSRPSLASFAPCVLMAWAWMNLHRGGLLAVVLLAGLALAMACAAGLERVDALRPLLGPRATWRQVGLAVGAALAAAMLGALNPSGLAIYRTGVGVVESAAVREYVSEWQPLTWRIAVEAVPVAIAVLLAGWLAVVVALGAALARGAAGRVHVWHVGLLGVLTWMGISAVRWLPLASLAAAACLALVIVPFIAQRTIERSRWFVALAAALAVALVFVSNRGEPGLGEAPHRYPRGALAFAVEHDLGPRVHNDFLFGGYLLWNGWPRFRDLVDGRHDMVFPGEHVVRCVRAQRDPAAFAALVAELPPDWVLASNTPGRESFVFLARDPSWRMIYWSEAAVVYVRAGSPLDELAYRFLVPADETASLARALAWAGQDPGRRAALRGELERALSEDPDAVRPNALLAIYHHQTGDHAARDELLRRLDQLDAEHPAVRALHRALGR